MLPGKFLLKSSSFRLEGFDLRAEARDEKPLSVSLQHDSLENMAKKSFIQNSMIINEHYISNLLCRSWLINHYEYIWQDIFYLKKTNSFFFLTSCLTYSNFYFINLTWSNKKITGLHTKCYVFCNYKLIEFISATAHVRLISCWIKVEYNYHN